MTGIQNYFTYLVGKGKEYSFWSVMTLYIILSVLSGREWTTFPLKCNDLVLYLISLVWLGMNHIESNFALSGRTEQHLFWSEMIFHFFSCTEIRKHCFYFYEKCLLINVSNFVTLINQIWHYEKLSHKSHFAMGIWQNFTYLNKIFF